MKIFLTGNKGYVGNVLAEKFVKQNYEVTGCDMEFYPQEFVTSNQDKVTSLKKDIRDITKDDLVGHSVVAHLAALSNDPLGEINSSLTQDINYLATIKLAKLSKEAGVERFIFSSSCSTYGATDEVVNESGVLSPITEYAKSKVNSETKILELKDEHFSPIILRSATAYGISPSQRLDLVVNNLTCSAFTTGSVKLLSDGTSWRPLVHVEDMSDAFIDVVKSPLEKVSGQIFNVGSNDENYMVKEIAGYVEEIVPNSKIEYSKDASKDSRSYRVEFDKIHDVIGYKTKWKLKDGIKQIYDLIKRKDFTEQEFKSEKYYRVLYIKWLINQGYIDNNFRMKHN